MFCRSLFIFFPLAIVLSVLLWFTDSDYLFGILWPLCCLSFFDLQILITSLASSNYLFTFVFVPLLLCINSVCPIVWSSHLILHFCLGYYDWFSSVKPITALSCMFLCNLNRIYKSIILTSTLNYLNFIHLIFLKYSFENSLQHFLQKSTIKVTRKRVCKRARVCVLGPKHMLTILPVSSMVAAVSPFV